MDFKEELARKARRTREKLHTRVSRGGTRQLFCENPHCAAKLVKRFVHFCEKTRMDIGGLSEKTLEKFIGQGFIVFVKDTKLI